LVCLALSLSSSEVKLALPKKVCHLRVKL